MLPVHKQHVINKYDFAIKQPCKNTPGSRYSYGSVDHMVLGELIRRKIQESPLSYFKRRILDPLELRYSGWHTDPSGNPALPYGAWTTAREWAKFGLFLRDGGRYKNKQILPAALLAQLTRGSNANPAYGLSVWLNRPVPADRRRDLIPQLRRNEASKPVLYSRGLTDMFVAAGHNGQRLYVIPSRGLVIVRMARRERAFSDQAFLIRLLEGKED
jgi:CubicO group peptidase (beta-lactamase class C family)